jgi:pyruvate formate lyase activating enzyme
MPGGIAGLAGWNKLSFVDYPGTPSTVLFFAGCDLRCPYCHNAALVNGPLPDPPPSAGEIRRFLKKRAAVVRGVVLTGGEPALHPALPERAKELRSLGLRVKLDSNGMHPEVTEATAPDYLALDVKTTPERYGSLLRSPYADTEARLARSVGLARRMGDRAEVRVTLAPGIVDEGVIRDLALYLKGVARIVLQPMRTTAGVLDPGFRFAPAFDAGQIGRFAELLAASGAECRVRGEVVF